MQLYEILHKSKGKVSDKGQTFRKAEIATDDRPYKEKKFDKIGRQTGDKREAILDTAACVSMGDKRGTMSRIIDADHSKKVGENVSKSSNDVNGRQTGDKREAILDTTACVSMGDKRGTMSRIIDADHSKKVGENVSKSSNDVNGRQTGDKREAILDTTACVSMGDKRGTMSRIIDADHSKKVGENVSKSSNDVNGRQTGDKREAILETTACVSMGDKRGTMSRIIDADHSKKVGENVSKSSNDVNGRQTGVKQETNSIEIAEDIKKPNITKRYNDDNLLIGSFLHGNEKRLYDFLYDSRQPGSNITFSLTKEKIIESVLIPDSCLKKTLSRIINKGFLKVYSSQSGRFGWRIFELN